MPRTKPLIASEDRILDEDVLVTILSRHFPAANRDALCRAAEDVLLLQILQRDEAVVWEDAMSEEPDRARAVHLHAQHRSRS